MQMRSPLALFFAAAALVMATSAHAAKLPMPKPLMPAPGAASQTIPVFGWAPVANADHYEFQVAADSGFNSPVIGSNEDHFVTRNTRATLKRTIPNGTYYWRVRAITQAGAVSPWTTPQQWKHAWTGAATLQTPVTGAGLSFPGNPLSLSWGAVPYAASYMVSIATDPALGSLVLHDSGSSSPVTTAATTLTSASVFAPGTYYWAITPVDARGNKGTASAVATFSWVWPSTTTPSVTDLDSSAEVYDPQFSWTAVPGAARYEVEAKGAMQVNEAENMLSGPARLSRFRSKLLERIEGIVRESVRPMEKIEAIKILHIDGANGGVQGNRNVTDEVIDSALRYRVQAPMIDSLMKEIGIEGGGLGRMTDVLRDAKDIASLTARRAAGDKDSQRSSDDDDRR